MLLGGKAVVTVRERSVITITEVPGRSTIELETGKFALAVARDPDTQYFRELAENPGEVVSKAALMETAWPGTAVEEGNLSVQIAEKLLREELSTEEKQHRLVEKMLGDVTLN